MEVGDNKCDDEVLRDICNEKDIELIKRIPLRITASQDSWFCLLDDKGSLTVKSCYRKLQGEHNWPQSAFWRKLWSWELPGKVTNFLWRVCRSCLPTTTALAVKKVHIDVRCSWCLVRNEDAIHVLFDCLFAVSVWTSAGLHDIIQVVHEDTVLNVIRRIFDTCTREQVVWIIMLCWSLWNRRNIWVWNKVNVSAFRVQAAVTNLLTRLEEGPTG